MSLKVLVIDDSSLMHSMYEMVLRKIGKTTIVHAMNGREGLTRLSENPDCELIILDINMPGMNGLEFLENYTNCGLTNLPPVVIISTEGTEDDTQRGLDAGAKAYLKKPFQPTELLEIVENILAAKAK